ncbi:Ubiquitin carboxyl-terminal hydrolase 2, partial [Diplonema papillatum]
KQTPTSTSRSPITSQSPGVMVTRTPSLLHKKNAFQRALPSPQNLTREPRSQYAGLLNVVQNCFMNCLLQAYFGCRGFTDAVLRYPCDWVYGSAKSALPQAKLVQRLQAVFSFLETSRSACVNPEYVLESVGANNPQFMDGGQHDPHEFADAFIDMICEAFQMRAAADKDLEAAQGDLHELVYGETVEMSVDTHGRVTGDARVEKPLHFIPLYLPAAGELIRGAPPPVTPCAKGIAIRHETKRHVIGNATPMRAGPLTDAASPCARQLFEQPGNTGSLSALCDELDSTCQRGLRSVANLVSHATDDDGSSKAALTDEDLTTTLPTSTEDASLLNTSLDSNATLGLPPSSPAETSAVNEEYEKGIDSEAVKLYDALDQLTIDFKEGSTTLQATVKSFRKLPQLLMFYIPARTGGLEHRMLDFGAKIHLDRYKSDPEADTARDTCRQLLVQQKNLIQKRASHESLAQRLEEAIASVAAPELPLARDELVSLYNMRENHLEAALQSYEEVGTLGRSVYQVYDNLEKRPENTYCLHAVIVHKSFGQGGGHYFSYALDKRTGKKNRWVKFDDAKVTTVAEDEVFSDETRRNVYCMFYEAENSIRRSQDINVKVPDELTTLIQHEDRRWERRTARTLVGPQLAERTAEKPSIPLPAAMP